MAMFDDKVKGQLAGILKAMKEKVNLVYFTQEMECHTCTDTHQFLTELSELNDRLNLTAFDFVKDAEKASYYGVDKIPGIVLLDAADSDTGIRFFGLPGGYEINSFLRSILEVSGVREPLSDAVLARIRAISKKTHIQVFISLACPYCPAAVSAAHRIALENPAIRADMVETSTFIQEAVKFNVSSVPKVVINGTAEFTGAQPIEKFVEYLEKA